MVIGGMMEKKEKRTWIYLQKPTTYCISCDVCNGHNIEWSDFQEMVWCCDCEIDTVGNPGVFGLPIASKAATLLGLCFDKLNIKTNEVLVHTFDKSKDIGYFSKGNFNAPLY